MAKIVPFHGLLPTVENVEKVAAVPYDVVNSQEAAELAGDNMLSFLRVSRPEIEMTEGVDLYDDTVYAKAAENFKRLCYSAPLQTDESAHLYIYYLKMGDHEQIGIAGAASVEDYDNDIIKKHEKTRQDKEDDRSRHVMSLRSHTGPVFLTYRDEADVNLLVNEAIKQKPLFDLTAPDGVVHKLWRVDTAISAKISEAFENVPLLYIADGHHRAKSASRVAQECKENNSSHTGREDYNFFLTVTFPASQLNILPYNRSVHNLNGMTPELFMEKIATKFTVTETVIKSPRRGGEISMYLGGKWYLLKPDFDTHNLGVIDSLDVSILQDNILAPLLGIDDPRTSKSIDFIGGIRGTSELERVVDSGRGAVAFSMYPTTVEQLMAIADAGQIMPPKSTWFEPKLRDGLVCHNF